MLWHEQTWPIGGCCAAYQSQRVLRTGLSGDAYEAQAGMDREGEDKAAYSGRTVLNLAAWTGIDSSVRRKVSPLTSSQAPFCNDMLLSDIQQLTVLWTPR